MSTSSDNVFAPPKSTVVDVPSGEESEKAGRGIRLLAKILDGLLFSLGFLPSYIAVFPQFAHATARAGGLQVWSLLAQTGGRFYLGVAVALVVIALDVLWITQNGQTVGKRICGIKIVRTNGTKPSFWRIFFLRYLISAVIPVFVPFVGALYGLVDICFIFGAARRCVHDYIADTIVVRA